MWNYYTMPARAASSVKVLDHPKEILYPKGGRGYGKWMVGMRFTCGHTASDIVQAHAAVALLEACDGGGMDVPRVTFPELLVWVDVYRDSPVCVSTTRCCTASSSIL